MYKGFPEGTVVKNLPVNSGDTGSISGSGRFPGIGNCNPLQSSCLENSINKGAWWVSPWACKESDTMEHAHATSEIYYTNYISRMMNAV